MPAKKETARARERTQAEEKRAAESHQLGQPPVIPLESHRRAYDSSAVFEEAILRPFCVRQTVGHEPSEDDILAALRDQSVEENRRLLHQLELKRERLLQMFPGFEEVSYTLAGTPEEEMYDYLNEAIRLVKLEILSKEQGQSAEEETKEQANKQAGLPREQLGPDEQSQLKTLVQCGEEMSDLQPDKFDPRECGGKELCIVVSYHKSGERDLRKLAKLLKDRADIRYGGRIKYTNPLDWWEKDRDGFKQHVYKLRRKAKGKCWYDKIPENYWSKSYARP